MITSSIRASAPGKAILFGEHAVVYGQPAVAIPVTQLQATATVEPDASGSGLTIVASDLKKRFTLAQAPRDEPLAAAARRTLAFLSTPEPAATLTIHSTIPIASGLGSGAAVSTALVHGLAEFLGHTPTPAEISAIVFEIEKLHHGTPSGIDNTVIAYEQPVYFKRGCPIERLAVGAPLALVIADTGRPSPTGEIVARVRQAWERDPARYDALFDHIGRIARDARTSIEEGNVDALGPLMDANHKRLIELGVSSTHLDRLVETARMAGAIGAKLSGAGQGGNMIALIDDRDAAKITAALTRAGAARVIQTRVEKQ